MGAMLPVLIGFPVEGGPGGERERAVVGGAIDMDRPGGLGSGPVLGGAGGGVLGGAGAFGRGAGLGGAGALVGAALGPLGLAGALDEAPPGVGGGERDLTPRGGCLALGGGGFGGAPGGAPGPFVGGPPLGLDLVVGVGPRPCPPPPSPSLARQRAGAVCARGPYAPLAQSPDHESCSATPPAPLVSAVVQAGSEAGRGCASPPLYLPFTISLENGCTSPGAGRSAPAAGQGEPSPTFPARR